ncbi:DUF2318 domain-containing protein [Geomonas paludis]|uniref:Membrane iron-sulfur containing protein FtrD-like domain-containing protein n=1 Tax=Geomonas paludis TaxID=2740185 RepID=A0A6V8N4S2_9BACT|nr:DUF2318 domain-containing protein [Geomonas paludis]GFO66289.1 hypothetical protein GMPD_42080 [Geomonas paludis]
MLTALKVIPQLLCWAILVPVLSPSLAGTATAVAAAAGFVAGVAGENLLLAYVGGEIPFRPLRGICGVIFLLLWGASVWALYRSGSTRSEAEPPAPGPIAAGAAAVSVGVLAGALTLCRLAPLDGGAVRLIPYLSLAGAGAVVALGAAFLAKYLPERLAPRGIPLLALVVSALMVMACSVQRLDLFSPLSMEVMKFIHDFVHQFFESMLIPDHPFFRSDVWGYIGLLFGDKVGLWGGLALWYLPVLFIALALRLERLPSVAHIRQGAARRKLLAAFIRERRLRLAAPLLALLFLTGAAYQSRFPATEYWDPKPIEVTATPAGQIAIPKKGEVDLEDGMLHKFSYRQGSREARFFVMLTPAGQLVTTLDACAICQPEGYGQAGNAVICYYCRTLIPLETVGKPGGCNPVPVACSVRGDAVVIDAMMLLNTWESTVQVTAHGKGMGK